MSTMHQKPNEAGWFYHAPARTSVPEPVGAPPASQIPGLGDITELPPEKPQEVMFRETDSKYIRLAKMGGRKDLLTIRPNSGTKRDARSYPRNEWFYLEDNAVEDKVLKEKDQEAWTFLLPEYMVHQARGETTLPDDTPRKADSKRHPPFATDPKAKQFSTGKPETRRPGCDVRIIKQTARVPKTDRSQPPPSQMHGDEPLKHHSLPGNKEEPTNMTKLLAYTYEREWHQKHQAWENKQANGRDRNSPVKASVANKASVKSTAASHKTGRGQTSDVNNNETSTTKLSEEPKSQPSKTSRVKNVPSRSTARRSDEGRAAMKK